MSEQPKISGSTPQPSPEQAPITKPSRSKAGGDPPAPIAPDPSASHRSAAPTQVPPKLPHERDQSAEQRPPAEADKHLRGKIERAGRDLAQAQEDTDCYGQRGLADTADAKT